VIEQAFDFRDESDALCALLEPLDAAAWNRATQFKGWTANDVIAHLHFGNYAADLALKDGAAFREFARSISQSIRGSGSSHLNATHAWLGGVRDRALLNLWRDYSIEMTERFATADPKQRAPWFGPDMSVRSSITARLMETWAHGQALYDLVGQNRIDGDRIRNIAILGINTFGWTFTNRGLPTPAAKPHVRLTAPSGAIWEWGERDPANLIEGTATEFCQVVAQTRNIADTSLRMAGATATSWMAVAQCFAAPPENPPPPGTRFRQAAVR
jgi:uncharacterized protein (TIGR03084 family)